MNFKRPFGKLEDRTDIDEIEIGAGALRAKILTYGTILRDLRLDGFDHPLVLGFDRLEDYANHSPFCGTTAGRYANRIANGQFELDGRKFQLSQNEAPHHLHGGHSTFARRLWSVASISDDSVRMTLVSPDGEDGYPGRLSVSCTYKIVAPASLHIIYEATTSAPTVVNMAHHSYFNLDGSPDILDHLLQIEADAYTPVAQDLIPTGAILPVKNTLFDFRTQRPVRTMHDGRRIAFDTNFVLGLTQRPHPVHAARLTSPVNGLSMEILTTEPGLQFYDGYKFDVPVTGLDGRKYGASAGLCLEPQRWPDSPNHKHFTDTTLRPGETYFQESIFRFGTG
ncbi:MAG: galactose-1-epimerase [Hyphomicrobiales bacterium]|nr:MAG: galactose-1-epimerase [Hyphomicrobiales bacterium]